jgi:hypothetical protein
MKTKYKLISKPTLHAVSFLLHQRLTKFSTVSPTAFQYGINKETGETIVKIPTLKWEHDMNLQEIKPLTSNKKKKFWTDEKLFIKGEHNKPVDSSRCWKKCRRKQGRKKKNGKSYIFHYLALDRSFMYYFYVLEH